MKRIVFYGDSNTFGYDPRGFMGGRYSEEVRWVDILDREMESVEVLGRGMNGRTIPTSKNEYENIERMISGLSPIDYFAIMLGTNDILLTERPDWELAARRMRNLIVFIKGTPAVKVNDTKIILISPPILFPGATEESPFYKYESNSKSLADAYREIALDEELISISADKWYVDLDYDGVHLSERGSEDFANRMMAVLKELV